MITVVTVVDSRPIISVITTPAPIHTIETQRIISTVDGGTTIISEITESVSPLLFPNVTTIVSTVTAPVSLVQVIYGGLTVIGGGGGDLPRLDILHAELVTLRDASGLTPGRQYRITDFRTCHRISIESTDAHTGELEPLTVTAVDAGTLHRDAFSDAFPDDIIFYSLTVDWEVADGEYYTYGRIYYREDPFHAISMHQDWRNIVCRWWEDAEGSGVYMSPASDNNPALLYQDFPQIIFFDDGMGSWQPLGNRVRVGNCGNRISNVVFRSVADKVYIHDNPDPIIFQGPVDDTVIGSCSQVRCYGNVHNFTLFGSNHVLCRGSIEDVFGGGFSSTGSLTRCQVFQGAQAQNQFIGDHTDELLGYPVVSASDVAGIVESTTPAPHRHMPEEAGAVPAPTAKVISPARHQYVGWERAYSTLLVMILCGDTFTAGNAPLAQTFGNDGQYMPPGTEIVQEGNAYRSIGDAYYPPQSYPANWLDLGLYVPPTTAIVKNVQPITDFGGWDTNNSYVQGSTVQHNGSLYVYCDTTPLDPPQILAPDADANWRDITALYNLPVTPSVEGYLYVCLADGVMTPVEATSYNHLFTNVYYLNRQSPDIISFGDLIFRVYLDGNVSNVELEPVQQPLIVEFVNDWGAATKTIRSPSVNGTLWGNAVFTIPNSNAAFYSMRMIQALPVWLGEYGGGLHYGFWSVQTDGTSDTYFYNESINEFGLVTPSIANLGDDITGITLRQEYAKNGDSPTFNGINQASYVADRHYDDFKRVIGRLQHPMATEWDTQFVIPEDCDRLHKHPQYAPKFHVHPYLEAIEKADVEAALTGQIASHNHNYTYTVYIAGEALVAGDIVAFALNSGNPDEVNLSTAGEDRPIGIVLKGAAQYEAVRIASGGRVPVNFVSNPQKGSIAFCSTTPGVADWDDATPVTEHWREIGHPTGASVALEGRTLYYVHLHFN